MLRIEKIQNLEIKGTIGIYKSEHRQLCELLERVSLFAVNQYKSHNIKKDVKVYHRISLNQKIFLVLVIKYAAKNNPYYAIMDMNNSENPIQYQTDIHRCC